jgi:hypothetical protein
MHLINQLEVQDVAFYQMHLQMTIMRVWMVRVQPANLKIFDSATD